MATFFTSDTHYRHKKILDFTDRPYTTIEEMEKDMIHNWNTVVTDNDIVYHLGDFSFGKFNAWKEILAQLNGQIILIQGNHDLHKTVKRISDENLVKEVHPVGTQMKLNENAMWLTHYPMEIGLRMRKFSICGHIHDVESTMINQINVGVDSPFTKSLGKPFGTPIHIDELRLEMERINQEMDILLNNKELS